MRATRPWKPFQVRCLFLSSWCRNPRSVDFLASLKCAGMFKAKQERGLYVAAAGQRSNREYVAADGALLLTKKSVGASAILGFQAVKGKLLLDVFAGTKTMNDDREGGIPGVVRLVSSFGLATALRIESWAWRVDALRTLEVTPVQAEVEALHAVKYALVFIGPAPV